MSLSPSAAWRNHCGGVLLGRRSSQLPGRWCSVDLLLHFHPHFSCPSLSSISCAGTGAIAKPNNRALADTPCDTLVIRHCRVQGSVTHCSMLCPGSQTCQGTAGGPPPFPWGLRRVRLKTASLRERGCPRLAECQPRSLAFLGDAVFQQVLVRHGIMREPWRAERHLLPQHPQLAGKRACAEPGYSRKASCSFWPQTCTGHRVSRLRVPP